MSDFKTLMKEYTRVCRELDMAKSRATKAERELRELRWRYCMKKYNIVWRNGSRQTVCGLDKADALRRAGIGRGAVAAMGTMEETKG
jgi:hypothetical protein